MRVQVRCLVLPEWSLDLDWECTLSGEERAELGEDWVAFAGLSSLEDGVFVSAFRLLWPPEPNWEDRVLPVSRSGLLPELFG